MSILCRGFSDIDKYTQGFPDNVVAGRMQAFKIAKKCLPGPYTFILNAGKELPKVCLDPKAKAKTAKRAKPSACAFGRAVTAALLSRLDRPLLSTTAPANAARRGGTGRLQDPAVMAEAFGEKLAFVVDAASVHPPSTVLDLRREARADGARRRRLVGGRRRYGDGDRRRGGVGVVERGANESESLMCVEECVRRMTS